MTYVGIAVFGPLDGIVISSPEPFHRAAVRTDYSAASPIDGEPAEITEIRSVGYHCKVIYTDDSDLPLRVWIPDGVTKREVVAQLLQSYAKG